MRILHTSDWHIGRSLFEYSLLEEQQFFFRQLFQIIEENHVDAVVVAGDIYDRSAPSADAVALLDTVLDHLINICKVPVMVIAGNHDSPRRIAYGNALFEQAGLYMEGLCRPQIKKVTLQDQWGPVHFFLLPYFVPQEVKNMLDDRSIDSFTKAFAALIQKNLSQIDSTQRNILVAHGFFMKLQNPNQQETELSLSQSEISVGTSDLTDLTPCVNLFDYVALGHLHAPQTAGNERFRYSGSPLKYSISEAANKKSVLLVDILEKGSLHVQSVPLQPLRDLQVLTGTMEELLNPSATAHDDFVYANITNKSLILHAMSQLRAVYPHILGLSFSCTPAALGLPAEHELKALPLNETFFEFYRQMEGEPIPELRKQLVNNICDELEKQKL